MTDKTEFDMNALTQWFSQELEAGKSAQENLSKSTVETLKGFRNSVAHEATPKVPEMNVANVILRWNEYLVVKQ